MTRDDVLSFIFGIGVGMLIGALISAFCLEISNKKFCPTCGKMYGGASVYCEDDGTLLKERGN